MEKKLELPDANELVMILDAYSLLLNGLTSDKTANAFVQRAAKKYCSDQAAFKIKVDTARGNTSKLIHLNDEIETWGKKVRTWVTAQKPDENISIVGKKPTKALFSVITRR